MDNSMSLMEPLDILKYVILCSKENKPLDRSKLVDVKRAIFCPEYH